MNENNYEFIRLETLYEYIEKLKDKSKYLMILNLLYHLLNKKNIRLGNVNIFFKNLSGKYTAKSSSKLITFGVADIKLIILEFFENVNCFKTIKHGLFLVIHICMILKQEKFLTITVLQTIEKKFSGKQRESILQLYLAVISTIFAEVNIYYHIKFHET